MATVDTWLARDTVRIVREKDDHWAKLRSLLASSVDERQEQGALVGRRSASASNRIAKARDRPELPRARVNGLDSLSVARPLPLQHVYPSAVSSRVTFAVSRSSSHKLLLRQSSDISTPP